MFQPENLEEIMSKFERHAKEISDTKLCHMGRELNPNFSKLSNSLG